MLVAFRREAVSGLLADINKKKTEKMEQRIVASVRKEIAGSSTELKQQNEMTMLQLQGLLN